MPSDNPTIAMAKIPERTTEFELEIQIGSAAARASVPSPMMAPRFRMVHSCRSWSGMGRNACTAAQLPRSSSSRPMRARNSSSAPTMMPNRATSTSPACG